jgi:hypothetical protein
VTERGRVADSVAAVDISARSEVVPPVILSKPIPRSEAFTIQRQKTRWEPSSASLSFNASMTTRSSCLLQVFDKITGGTTSDLGSQRVFCLCIVKASDRGIGGALETSSVADAHSA